MSEPHPATGPPDAPPGADVPAELRDHPRYRVVGLLGVGGMGAVYKAEHQLMERVVALKVISRGLLDTPGTVERFRREVKAAARLAHPNIVTAYDADQAGSSHFLIMEYVDGISLDRLVAEHGRLPVREACEYMRQAAVGLQHAFECGTVHRDVKPQNLMLTPSPFPLAPSKGERGRGEGVGQIKILDFGLARLALERSLPEAPAQPPTGA